MKIKDQISNNQTSFDKQTLVDFALFCLKKVGLKGQKAEYVAEILVEGDLLGHRTHGLQLLEAYLNEIENGGMLTQGKPEVLAQKASVATWNGRYLPGPWLVRKAIEWATARAKKYGTATVVIQKCHHIACLAAYLEAVTQQNLMIQLSCSDPRNRTVAPYGGLTPLYSPNPLAFGIPTSTYSILMDISMSTTANAVVAQKYQAQQKLPHKWLLDKNGNPTDDPSTFFEDTPSTILPLGGTDTGYKGFGLGIMVEAMTNALGGYGRAQHPTSWGASVFLQILDPSVFGGLETFIEETDFFIQESLKAHPIDPLHPVRLPGTKGLLLKQTQLKSGINLHEQTIQSLKKLVRKYC